MLDAVKAIPGTVGVLSQMATQKVGDTAGGTLASVMARLKGQGATARLYYLVRAVTPGTYTVPPPQAEDMYQPTLRGTGLAKPATVTVAPP